MWAVCGPPVRCGLWAAGQLRPGRRKDNDDRAVRGSGVQLPECASCSALQLELTRRAVNQNWRDCCRRGRGTGLGRRGGCLPGVQGSRGVSRGEADEQSRDAEDDGDRRRPPPAGRRPVAALLQDVRTFRRLTTPRRVIWPPPASILAAHLVMVSGPQTQRPRQKMRGARATRTRGLLDANYRRRPVPGQNSTAYCACRCLLRMAAACLKIFNGGGCRLSRWVARLPESRSA